MAKKNRGLFSPLRVRLSDFQFVLGASWLTLIVVLEIPVKIGSELGPMEPSGRFFAPRVLELNAHLSTWWIIVHLDSRLELRHVMPYQFYLANVGQQTNFVSSGPRPWSLLQFCMPHMARRSDRRDVCRRVPLCGSRELVVATTLVPPPV